MTMTAINLQRLDDCKGMVPHSHAESLWKELEEEEVPVHMWHDWVKLRSNDYTYDGEDEEGDDVIHLAGQGGPVDHTPELTRAVRRAVTGDEKIRVRDYLNERTSIGGGGGGGGAIVLPHTPEMRRHRVNSQADPLVAQLWRGAMEDDVSLLDEAIEKGARVNAAEEDGWTALHCAVESHSLSAAQLLIDQKADVNLADSASHTALHLVCMQNAARSPPGTPPQQQGPACPALASPAAAGIGMDIATETIVQKLIDGKTDLAMRDERGWTPLHHAASQGHAHTVCQLVGAKADIQLADPQGRAPLHLAAGQGHAATVQRLIEAPGVKIDATDGEERTALHHAAVGSYGQAFQCLMAAGAELKPDNTGKVALDLVPGGIMDSKWVESCSRAEYFASTSPRGRGDSNTQRPTAAAVPAEAGDETLWGRLRGRFRSSSSGSGGSPRAPPQYSQ